MKDITNQQLGLLGENLVIANLLAHGWDAVNLNVSFGNFKNIDVYCQNDKHQVACLQVKTIYRNDSALIGMTSKDAAELNTNNKIMGPWVFVKVNSLHPLIVDYYILSRSQMIEITSKLHNWYLYEWKRKPTPSLENSPAGMQLWTLEGKNRKSKYATVDFINPFNSHSFLNKWGNIWIDGSVDYEIHQS